MKAISFQSSVVSLDAKLAASKNEASPVGCVGRGRLEQKLMNSRVTLIHIGKIHSIVFKILFTTATTKNMQSGFYKTISSIIVFAVLFTSTAD